MLRQQSIMVPMQCAVTDVCSCALLPCCAAAAAGNHLEALPSGLHGLRRLSHLGLALNYYKTWRHAVPCFAALAQTLQVGFCAPSLQVPLFHAVAAVTRTVSPKSASGACFLSFLGVSSFLACLRPRFVTLPLQNANTQELELQHTATVLTDSDGFLEVVGQLTALTSLAAGSNQMSDLPEAWRQLKRLKVRAAVCYAMLCYAML